MLAAKNGNIEMTQRLLDSGKVDINKTDKCGKTALMMAAEYNKSDIIKTLLRYGADVTKVDKEGNTALMLARNDNKQIIVSILDEAKEAAENKKSDLPTPPVMLIKNQNWRKSSLQLQFRAQPYQLTEILITLAANLAVEILRSFELLMAPTPKFLTLSPFLN